MSKAFRDTLFFIFIIIFIILSISISLYAAGYRLVWRWPLDLSQALQRTGMLIVESRPNNALIEISNYKSERPITTPAKISNLLPGEYLVKLEKEGYWPIERRIKIFPNQTSHLTNLFLFKKSLAVNIYQTNSRDIITSPKQTHLFFPAEKKVLNLRNELITNLEDCQNIESLKWSLDNKKTIIDNKVIDLQTAQVLLNLSEISQTEMNNVFWDEARNRFFYQNKNNLYLFSLTNNDPQLVLSDKNILDYIVKNNRLHAIEKENNLIYLNTYSLNTQLKARSILLPEGNYSFHFPSSSFLNIYEKDYKRLIVINDNIYLNQQKIIDRVSDWHWASPNHLLWHNGHELYSWRLNQGEELLIRISEPITGFAWHTQRNYLVYSTDKAIYLSFEENNRKRNIEILRASNISSLILDSRTNLIYFNAQIGRQTGIFKMFVQ